ncbi:MAG TPA: vWA domain-containing protein, partial [Actinomycetota bacterium]
MLNDLMIVVDKSGSMGYRTTPLDQTAFQAAFSAGLGHYNRTPAQRKSGLSVFDSAVTRSIPYSLRGAQIRSASEFNLTAGGNTNLCSAISDAAAQVRAGGTSDAVGHMVLLTDGRPTVPGCDTGAAVRDAAMKACLPGDGGKPVAISAVAFGDADFALIQQISDLCGGISRFVDDSGPDQCGGGPRVTAAAAACPGPGPQPAPINIKVASARLAYRVRDYHEALFVQEPKPLVFERSFDLPPGTAELEAVWMGELFEFIDEAGGSFCRFDRDYTFELVDPAGNPAGFDPVTPGVELQYLTRTRRVTQPEPGRWTMRVTGGAPCVTDNEFHAPSVAMFAMYRNHALKGHLALDQARIKANEPLRVSAVLETGPNTAAAGIAVTARLVNGPRQVPVPMFDDGVNGGDAVAGDGKYSGLLNPSCSEGALLPGSYRLMVEYQSDAATAQSKLFPDSDVLLYADPLSVSPPASASLVEERTVVVDGCHARFPGWPGQEFRTNLCPEPGVLVGGGVTIVPGTTVRDMTVDVQSCPIGTTGVTVAAGPGVQVSHVRSSYDDALAKGHVTFDLTAAANAPRGEQPIRVFWGRQRCDILGCTGDTTAPVITPGPSVVDVCRPKPQPVQVPPPQTTDNCAARTPHLTGEVIAVGGRPLP